MNQRKTCKCHSIVAPRSHSTAIQRPLPPEGQRHESSTLIALEAAPARATPPAPPSDSSESQSTLAAGWAPKRRGLRWQSRGAQGSSPSEAAALQ
eukprot:scaffold3190_cov409-Prasinococcus_capsulatus_cf.AAC.8